MATNPLRAVRDLYRQVNQLTEEVATLKKMVRNLPDRNASVMQPVVELSKLSADPMRPSSFGGMALQTRNVLDVVFYILQHRPARVVEFGSGQSTVWIARALQRTGSGQLISFDHDPYYYRATERLLQAEGLPPGHSANDLGTRDVAETSNVVDLRLAELTEITTDGSTHQWYDTAAIQDLSEIDLLLVDGPPGWIQDHARYPAFPVMRDRLAAEAAIFIDDAQRTEEREVITKWLASGGINLAYPESFDSRPYPNLVQLHTASLDGTTPPNPAPLNTRPY